MARAARRPFKMVLPPAEQSLQLAQLGTLCGVIEVQVPPGGDKYDASYSWTQNDVIINLLGINKNRQNPEYHTELMCISDSVICENIFVPENNCVYLLEFSRMGREWFLTQLLVNH